MPSSVRPTAEVPGPERGLLETAPASSDVCAEARAFCASRQGSGQRESRRWHEAGRGRTAGAAGAA